MPKRGAEAGCAPALLPRRSENELAAPVRGAGLSVGPHRDALRALGNPSHFLAAAHRLLAGESNSEQAAGQRVHEAERVGLQFRVQRFEFGGRFKGECAKPFSCGGRSASGIAAFLDQPSPGGSCYRVFRRRICCGCKATRSQFPRNSPWLSLSVMCGFSLFAEPLSPIRHAGRCAKLNANSTIVMFSRATVAVALSVCPCSQRHGAAVRATAGGVAFRREH